LLPFLLPSFHLNTNNYAFSILPPTHFLFRLSFLSSLFIFTLTLTTTLSPLERLVVRVQVKIKREGRKERREREWKGGRVEKA
jgi:hypothetical protein